MRDLYKEGYQDATKEIDLAMTAAFRKTGDPLEQLNLIITHLHGMNLRTNTKTDKEDDVTFEDFLQEYGILHIVKGGI